MAMREKWEELLGSAAPCDHFVQLYQDEAFLARAVSYFLAAGLASNEAVVVIATRDHGAMFTERLSAAGFAVADLVEEQQLIVLDAEECLGQFMVDGTPNRVAFFTLVKSVLDRPRAAGFTKVRLYGEMVDLLWDHNLEATLELEGFWNQVIVEQNVSLLCAYRIDNFDRNAHRGVLHRLCRCHSHLIPVEDYERFDRAVQQAYAEVFGTSGDGETLRSLLMSNYASTPKMPAAQGALLALRQVSPNLADSVLERARLHYENGAPTPTPR